jgi:hypothetical protein
MNKDRVYFVKKPPIANAVYKKKIAWPFYKFYIYAPKRRNDDLDTLQRLLLQLAIQNQNETPRMLQEYFDFNRDFIDRIKKECEDQQLIDSNWVVTENGQKLLLNDSQSFIATEDAPKEKLIMYKDAVSGDVVPYFHAEEITDSFFDDHEMVRLPANVPYQKQPHVIEILQALKVRKKIETYVKSRKSEHQSTEQLTDFTPVEETVDEYDVFAPIADWESVNDDGEIEDPSVAMEEQEATRKETASTLQQDKRIRVDQQPPQKVYVETFLYFEDGDFENYYVQSPFQSHDEWWFTKKLVGATLTNAEVASLIEEFLKEVSDNEHLLQQRFQDKKIPLLFENKEIIERPELQQLLKEIRKAHYSLVKYEAEPEDYDILFIRQQKVLEALLDACILTRGNRAETLEKFPKGDFLYQINRMANELQVPLPKGLVRVSYEKRLKYVFNGQGSSLRERTLFFLIDAYYHATSPSVYLLKSEPNFFYYLDMIAQLRNEHAHTHSDNQKDRDIPEMVKMSTNNLTQIVNIMIAHYFKGEQ